jgi:two-component system cell cycle response regulator
MAGRILIADGVATNRIILKVKLDAACYDVVQAANADTALRMACELRPDLVILDHALPGGGVPACRSLKAHAATASIPVVMVSPLGDRQVRLAGLQAGADEVLTKPMDEQFLLALARNLIRSHAGHDELARRHATAGEPGFSEGSRPFARPAHIALIAPRRETALAWRGALKRFLSGPVELSDRSKALEPRTATPVPDVFILSVAAGGGDRGIGLVSELRSHAATRHSVIVVHDGDSNPELAAMVLDLGASMVVTGPFDGEEIAARIKGLLPRKFEADLLRESLEHRLSLAMKDPLTGLSNRRHAQDYLARLASEAKKQGQGFALMMLDLDRFKEVNDTFGHVAGDRVLVVTAHRLRQSLREIDLLARIGGEEFLVALPATGRRQAEHAAERLRAVIGSQPIALADGREVKVTLSIGVAMAPVPETGEEIGIDQLIERADRALYASKTEGRNLVTFVRPAA